MLISDMTLWRLLQDSNSISSSSNILGTQIMVSDLQPDSILQEKDPDIHSNESLLSSESLKGGSSQERRESYDELETFNTTFKRQDTKSPSNCPINSYEKNEEEFAICTAPSQIHIEPSKKSQRIQRIFHHSSVALNRDKQRSSDKSKPTGAFKRRAFCEQAFNTSNTESIKSSELVNSSKTSSAFEPGYRFPSNKSAYFLGDFSVSINPEKKGQEFFSDQTLLDSAPKISRHKSRAGRKPLSGVFGICRQDSKWIVSYRDDNHRTRHRYFLFQNESDQWRQLEDAKRFLWKVIRSGRKLNTRDGEGLEDFVKNYESDGTSELLGIERASPWTRENSSQISHIYSVNNQLMSLNPQNAATLSLPSILSDWTGSYDFEPHNKMFCQMNERSSRTYLDQSSFAPKNAAYVYPVNACKRLKSSLRSVLNEPPTPNLPEENAVSNHQQTLLKAQSILHDQKSHLRLVHSAAAFEPNIEQFASSNSSSPALAQPLIQPGIGSREKTFPLIHNGPIVAHSFLHNMETFSNNNFDVESDRNSQRATSASTSVSTVCTPTASPSYPVSASVSTNISQHATYHPNYNPTLREHLPYKVLHASSDEQNTPEMLLERTDNTASMNCNVTIGEELQSIQGNVLVNQPPSSNAFFSANMSNTYSSVYPALHSSNLHVTQWPHSVYDTSLTGDGTVFLDNFSTTIVPYAQWCISPEMHRLFTSSVLPCFSSSDMSDSRAFSDIVQAKVFSTREKTRNGFQPLKTRKKACSKPASKIYHFTVNSLFGHVPTLRSLDNSYTGSKHDGISARC